MTKTEKDLTSTINPTAIVYEVLKPKKKKRKPPVDNGPAPQPQLPDPDPVDPDPAPSPQPPPPFGRLPGYGACGWQPTGGPPRDRAARILGTGGALGVSSRTLAPPSAPAPGPALRPEVPPVPAQPRP